MSADVLLAVVSTVPVLRALQERLIPLAAPVNGWVFAAFADELSAKVDQALAGVPTLAPFVEETEAPGDAKTHADLRALARVLGLLLEGAPLAHDGYLQVSVRVIASIDREAVRARLAKAGLEVQDLAQFLSRLPVSEDDALTRAMSPFEEHFSAEEAESVRRWLTGPDAAVPETLRSMRSDYYADAPGGFLSDALTGAVECWNARISGKLLDLWIALRKTLETDVHLGLGDDELPPELGVDRARSFAEALRARGLHPALAAVTARSLEGQSTWFYAPTLLATPELFDEAAKLDRGLAEQLAVQAVPRMGLEDSPTVREHVRRFLAARSPAFGPEALAAFAELEPDAIDERHLADAEGDVVEACKLAAKLEGRFPGALRRANERLASAAPAPFARALARALDRKREVIDAEVAWARVLECLEADPGAPFGDDEYVAFTLLDALPKPTAAQKVRIAALIKAKGAALGALRKKLDKLAGAKPPASPYKDADLAGLGAACAKAIKTARTRSWEAGIQLPKGLSEKAIARDEKALMAPLPEDLRAFYALHDGGGEDECFEGARLFGLHEAVEKRAWLLEVQGAPFDPTWLPITDDGAGNHACVVLSGKNAGAVFDFDHESGCGRKLAKSFASFLQSARWGD